MIIELFIVVAFADSAKLNKECFQKNNGRACVQLGTTLWQTPATREEARKAFVKGCALKQESACTLKDLKSPAKPVAKSDFSIPRSRVLSHAADLDNLLNTAEMEANPKGGYRFVSIDPKSPFLDLGFEAGDVLTHVNGNEIKSASDATALLPTLVFESNYQVKLTRAGQTRTHNYTLTD